MDGELIDESGFSLLECLVVVALIAILGLVSVGQFSGVNASAARKRAKLCVSEIALELSRQALRPVAADFAVPHLACIAQLSPRDYAFTVTPGEGEAPLWAVAAEPQTETIRSIACSRIRLDETGNWTYPGSPEGACR